MENDGASLPFRDWLRAQVESEDYWFQRIDLGDGLVTPGWSDPVTEKLPFFGLPDDMSGMRVLDIGCCEGFFAFEAERRGATDVVAIDSFPESIRRFNICRTALGSKVEGLLGSVYDLEPKSFGTFDLVMYFGVLYHLRHPLLSLQKVASVTSGTLLLQTRGFELRRLGDRAMAEFHVHGIQSGPADNPTIDPTVVWVPNGACIREMLAHVGFVQIEPVIPPAGGPSSSVERPSQPRNHHGSLRRAAGRLRPRGSRRPAARPEAPRPPLEPVYTSHVFRAEAPVRSRGESPVVHATGSDGVFTGASKL